MKELCMEKWRLLLNLEEKENPQLTLNRITYYPPYFRDVHVRGRSKLPANGNKLKKTSIGSINSTKTIANIVLNTTWNILLTCVKP